MTNSADGPLTLVLVGPMGAGKTSVGRRVGKILGAAFVDTDRLLVAEHGPIPELFEAHGEARFRDLEREAVSSALAGGGVISLGGGAVTDAGTRALLVQHPVVYLTVTPEAVAHRIHQGRGRPLLTGDDPVGRWTEIFEARRGWYDEVADLTVDTSRRPMHRIAEEIADWRRELPT